MSVRAAALLCVAFAVHHETARSQPPTPITVEFSGGQFPLAPPTLDGTQSAEDQVAALKPILRGLPFKQFVRDSIVAPVRIQLRYLKDASGQRVGHDIHAAFVVHVTLDEFSPESFAKRMTGGKRGEDDFKVVELNDQMLRERGLSQDDQTLYRIADVELLEKVSVRGLFEFKSTRQGGQRRIDFEIIEDEINRWYSVREPSEGDTYTGLAGFLTATELVDTKAVLIEVRVLMHEPEGWFAGSNFLRSKLPLVLQESAREIRRSLK